MDSKPVLLFDGVCNLCNDSVNFIIDRDRKEKICFASLQSEFGQEVLHKFGLPKSDFSTAVLVIGDHYYTKSTAALHIFKNLGFPWSILFIFVLVPAFVRNGEYSIVAPNRYRWFGKQEMCRAPTPELRKRFLG